MANPVFVIPTSETTDTLSTQLTTVASNVSSTQSAMTNLTQIKITKTDAGDVVLPQSTQNYVVYVNKTTSQATQVYLPPNAFDQQTVTVKDRKGEAATYPINVLDPNGLTIDGAANYVMQTNREAIRFTMLNGNWVITYIYKRADSFANVAYTGSYTDLTNKPTIPSITGLATTASLATVATTGSYTDLTNKPTIPSITGLATTAQLTNFDKVYNSAGLVTSPKTWIGQATTDASGNFTASIASAGFTAISNVQVQAVAIGSLTSGLVTAFATSATTTTVTGACTMTARTVGVVNVTAAAAGVLVYIFVAGV